MIPATNPTHDLFQKNQAFQYLVSQFNYLQVWTASDLWTDAWTVVKMSWAVLVLLDSLNHACKVAKDVLMVSQSKIKAYFGKDAIKISVLMFAIDSY